MTAIQISGDGWPASSLKGWGVVVEVDEADQVTVSVAGLDRGVAVGLLREAADALEGAPPESTCEHCGAGLDLIEITLLGDPRRRYLRQCKRAGRGCDALVVEITREWPHATSAPDPAKRPPGLPPRP